MVEVFKTNVQQLELAAQLASALSEQFPFFKINFDLEDCDKILRIEANDISPRYIESLLQTAGFDCRELDF